MTNTGRRPGGARLADDLRAQHVPVPVVADGRRRVLRAQPSPARRARRAAHAGPRRRAVAGRLGRLRALGLRGRGRRVRAGLLGGLRVVLLRDAPGHRARLPGPGVLRADRHDRRSDVTSRADGAVRSRRSTATPAAWHAGSRRCSSTSRSCFGALLTHAGWLDLHLVGALAVFVAGSRGRPRGSAAPATPVAAPGRPRRCWSCSAVQLLLGVGAYLARFSADLDSGRPADHAGAAGRPSPGRRPDPGRHGRPGRARDGRRAPGAGAPSRRGAPSVSAR